MNAQFLEGYPSAEKTAYITAIASISTADQSASEEEIAYLENLAISAGLSTEEKEKVSAAAIETSGEALKTSLELLKSSELRFSLVADLIAVAKVDSGVSEAEQQHVKAIADYLKIDERQLEALKEYVDKTTGKSTAVLGLADAGSAPGALGGLLDKFGLGDKLQKSGINIGSLAKGLISMIGPMVIGSMLNKGLSRGRNTAGAANQGGLGNLGSIISSLGGGKGMGGIGGMLSGLLK